jgi:hypothetical protein
VKISDKLSNEKLRKSSKIVDVHKKVKELKWNWAGHFQRHSDESRWPKIIENWKPESSTRRRGRPNVRWVDEIKNYAGGIFWKNKAKNRVLWKNMGDVFAQI